jgi:hypothetical protein
MKTKSKFIRIKLSTYLKLRQSFKVLRGESMADYFERLVLFIQKLREEAQIEGYRE